jgi:hypothetical protein
MKIRASLTGSALREPALNAQRSNRSAANPAAVRGAIRSPMSAQRGQPLNGDVYIIFIHRGRIGIHGLKRRPLFIFP